MPVFTIHETEAARAAAMLRSAIAEGRLLPGAPLSRRKLAGDLGMSSVPVAEALTRLEAEGLVESRPRAGTRVRIATPEEINGNYVLREALETHSARLFAESATPAIRSRLLASADRLDRSYETLTKRTERDALRLARVERVHIAFHMLVASATGVPVLAAAIERSRVLIFNQIFNISTGLRRLPARWHAELAAVLVGGSPAEAAEAMRVHVRFRQDEVIQEFRRIAERAASEPRMVRGPQRKSQEA